MVRISVGDGGFSFGRQVPQVIIMVLEDYSPVDTALRLLYRAIECVGSVKPCGKCAFCLAKDRKPGVEIISFGSEHGLPKEAVLKIKETAESSGAASGARRVFVITGVEHMSPQAANALLKFLEQTAPGVFFILTTRNLPQVLPTVVSRATAILLQPDFALFKREVSAIAPPADLDILVNACADVTQAQRLLADPAYAAFVEGCRLMEKYQAGKANRMGLINALKLLAYPHLAMCRRYLANRFASTAPVVALMTNLDRKPLKVLVADEIADCLGSR